MEVTRENETYRLESRLWLPRTIDEIWPFFADPANLNRITPELLSFEMLTPTPIEMKVGALIDYRLKVHGVPIRWRSKIAEWDPPHGFVDRQVRGPYRLWHHRHLFLSRAGGTECVDRVNYRLPFGVVGRLAHAVLVQRDVRAIFQHRSKVLSELFGPGQRGERL